AVHLDEIAWPRRLARNDDLILAEPALEGERGRLDRREHHALIDDLFRGLAEVAVRVLLHFRDDELLVERPAIDADPHGPAVVDRHSADRGKLLVAAAAGADVAGVDAVFVERARAVWKLSQQEMAVVVEVADERRGAAGIDHAALDLRNRGRGLWYVDRDPHHVRSGLG